MKIKILILIFAFCFLNSLAAIGQTIDNFSGYPEGKLPSSWRTWPFQRGKAMEVYLVRSENGNKFISANDAKNLSVQILKDFHWDVKEYPVFSWRWRAQKLPLGADETNPATNDSACGVYVILSKARQEMMKYTWSTTKPVGTVYEKNPGKAYIIAIDNGSTNLHKWQDRTVNVLEDYKKYFHKDLDKDPVAIALLTDGNATGTEAKCDYDNFTIERAK